jgi:hypothetical protein
MLDISMNRQITWKDKLPDGRKRETRVTIFGGEIKWQFKCSGDEMWDYKAAPTKEQWDDLIEKMQARYQRRNAPLRDVELVIGERRRLFGKG